MTLADSIMFAYMTVNIHTKADLHFNAGLLSLLPEKLIVILPPPPHGASGEREGKKPTEVASSLGMGACADRHSLAW